MYRCNVTLNLVMNNTDYSFFPLSLLHLLYYSCIDRFITINNLSFKNVLNCFFFSLFCSPAPKLLYYYILCNKINWRPEKNKLIDVFVIIIQSIWHIIEIKLLRVSMLVAIVDRGASIRGMYITKYSWRSDACLPFDFSIFV
jgi:hypothetical protein